MNLGGDLSFDSNTIIDFVVLPDIQVGSIISNLLQKYNNVVIMDTKGNLSEYSNLQNERIEYNFIYSLENLYNKIKSLKCKGDFLLVIDSITFVCDISLNSINEFIRLLWDTIYECNATIVTINHYRVEKTKRGNQLVPRMGNLWSKTVSYQVSFYIKENNFRYKIKENKIELL